MRPDKLKGYLQVLNREVRRLEEMIDGLLTLSLIQQGQTQGEFEPINLNSICQDYTNDRIPMALNKGLQIEFEPEAGLPMVYGEPSHIGQVLSILLTNALNYTPEGGRIALKTVARQGHGRTWAGFCVCDTGPGISAEEKMHLFERFYRGKAGRDSNVPGTGLGLSIVKEIIERHHGLVEVESEGQPGQGAQFRVWLPCAEG
jgi:signal transduction histidine kinase